MPRIYAKVFISNQTITPTLEGQAALELVHLSKDWFRVPNGQILHFFKTFLINDLHFTLFYR